MPKYPVRRSASCVRVTRLSTTFGISGLFPVTSVITNGAHWWPVSVWSFPVLGYRLTSLSRRECAPAVNFSFERNRRGWIFKGLSVAARWLVTLCRFVCGMGEL